MRYRGNDSLRLIRSQMRLAKTRAVAMSLMLYQTPPVRG
ncbi:Uncharacterised protein [Bordetella pertussis]|nr:Uncharacterised protein [Bordetella pertussis]CFO66016.1 Uncharacterised protein [Bordetella pertussis]CFU81186.1 Uncharacterised protein [Bordetella pertussis]CPI25181.1 Uncharacterised protein [Bordetella pertussis]CPK59037.1 Uncharacterised protein [Bordetella pertussis]